MPSGDENQEIDHEVISISGAADYALSCRYWPADEPTDLVVAVHGVISHSLWLENIALPLSKNGVSVLAMDRRGSGMNLRDTGDAPSVETLLEDLKAVLQWCRQWSLPIHICGFCWGSNYVINYLQTDHVRVPIKSMIFIAPSVFASEFIKQQPFKTGDSGSPSEDPVTPIDRFTDGPMFESFIKPDPLRLRKVSRRFNLCIQRFADGLWLKLLRISLPCLMLLADKDAVVDNRATEQLFQRLKVRKKQLHILSGSHGIQFDQPQQTADLILAWLSDNNNDDSTG